MLATTLFSLALSLPAASAVYQGFNYGATNSDGSAVEYSYFKELFTTAQGLVGTNGGFTSARLYTMIQSGTTNTPIEAIQAAIDTNTSLLLGMWASGGAADFANELAALKSAISTYPDLASSIAGISVASTIVDYISQVRTAISGTSWSGVSIGHVDTWNAWTNSTSSSVISAVDWLGVDEYPYYQTTTTNSIENAESIFESAYEATVAVADGKEIWITESGWPVAGSTENLAVAGLANAKTYWDTVGCPLFGVTNTWWFTLQDAYPKTPSPTFGVVGTTLSTTPLYDLSCANVTNSSSSTSTSSSSSSSATASSSSTGGSSSSSSGKATGGGSGGSYTNGTATATGSSSSATGGSSSSGSSSSGSSSSSSSGNSTTSSGSGTTSAQPYTGAASSSNLGSSAAGIFGAVAAAVLLL